MILKSWACASKEAIIAVVGICSTIEISFDDEIGCAFGKQYRSSLANSPFLPEAGWLRIPTFSSNFALSWSTAISFYLAILIEFASDSRFEVTDARM